MSLGLLPSIRCLCYIYMSKKNNLNFNNLIYIVLTVMRRVTENDQNWYRRSLGDLKDWCITKELALDRREWNLAIHVPEPWFSIPSFLLSSVKVFFPTPFRLFLPFIIFSHFVKLIFVINVLHFSSSFSILFYFCFFCSCDFISSLP
jgi:hypothetical protein